MYKHVDTVRIYMLMYMYIPVHDVHQNCLQVDQGIHTRLVSLRRSGGLAADLGRCAGFESEICDDVSLTKSMTARRGRREESVLDSISKCRNILRCASSNSSYDCKTFVHASPRSEYNNFSLFLTWKAMLFCSGVASWSLFVVACDFDVWLCSCAIAMQRFTS